MKYVKRFLGALVLCAVGVVVWRSGLNYTGYCRAQDRYLSEDEKFDLAIKNILQTYPPTFTESTVGGIRYRYKSPDNPIVYTDIAEFKAVNKNCCEIAQVSSDGEGYRVSLYHRITGGVSGLVHVKYLVRYKDGQGNTLSKLNDGDHAISNCGRVWSGI